VAALPENESFRPRAVICDLDGTLVDSYAAITASVNHVRACRGLPPLAEATVRRHVGRGLEHLLRELVPGTELDVDAARYRAHHPSVLQAGSRLLPNVVPTLAFLRESDVRLAVCSNKPKAFTQELLVHLRLRPYFDAVVGPEDAPRLKPAPDMLLAALAALRVEAAEALYVGDMVVDIRTARAAAVRVWVLPTGSEERQTLLAAGPDRLLNDFADLVDCVGRARVSWSEGQTRSAP
jgi:phosphoglycolate phosphatase